MRPQHIMESNSDASPDEGEIVKKCPICHGGIIEFEGNFVGAHGDCNNSNNHEDKYDCFEITKIKPFTIKHEQESLCTYIMPTHIPHTITEKGLKFSVRDATDEEKIKEAVLLSVEGLNDWMESELMEQMEWTGINWDEFDEIDDGITEYILDGEE